LKKEKIQIKRPEKQQKVKDKIKKLNTQIFFLCRTNWKKLKKRKKYKLQKLQFFYVRQNELNEKRKKEKQITDCT